MNFDQFYTARGKNYLQVGRQDFFSPGKMKALKVAAGFNLLFPIKIVYNDSTSEYILSQPIDPAAKIDGQNPTQLQIDEFLDCA